MARITGLAELEKALTGLATSMGAATSSIVADAAHLVETKAKRNFVGAHKKGLPHQGGDRPNVVTGTLRRSIYVDGPHASGLAVATAKVGPSTVYGRRVELGYTGTDSRGRNYDQPAYPYFRPAVADATPEFTGIAVKRWREAMGRL